VSEAFQKRAEIAKLARLLGRSPDQLGYLQAITSDDIRELREQVTEVLFSSGGALGRLAAASRLLPVGLVATIAERVFGAVLSARIAGLVEPDRAVQMAAKLPTEFLADIAVELDPRRARAVIAKIPPAQIAAITHVLVARDEYVTMGRFVGHLDTAAIAAAVAAMSDRALLQVAFVLENPDNFGDLLGQLSTPRLEHVIDTAAAEDLWPEALDLLTRLDDEQRREVIEVAAAREDEVLDALIESAHRDGMWELVLPLTGLMGEDSLRRFASLRSLQADGVLEEIVDASVGHAELWGNLVPIIAFLPELCQARVAKHVSGLTIDAELLLAQARSAGVADRLGPLGQALSA
jgi:hypothetical protein